MRKNTKILVETWRRFLNESTIDRIFESIQTLYFYNESKEKKGRIQLIDRVDRVEIKYLDFDEITGTIECDNISDYSDYVGYDESVVANGRPVWQVSYASTSETWGPLLYDVCLEYISNIKGGALMSDRNQVSEDAERVWEKYQSRTDVIKVQMDFGELGSNFRFWLDRSKLPGRLGVKYDENLKTPYSIYYNTDKDENDYPIKQYSPNKSSDDVNQHSTFANLIKKGKSVEEVSDEWSNSPLSKAYYKENLDVITKLKSLNLYIEE